MSQEIDAKVEEFVTLGFTNVKIAEMLEVSQETVKRRRRFLQLTRQTSMLQYISGEHFHKFNTG